jgi:hypothetical protein
VLSRADDGRACLERAANALHCPRIDSKLFRNDAHTGAPRSRQGLTDSFFECRGNWGPPEALSFTSGPRKPARTRSAIIARSNSANTPNI